MTAATQAPPAAPPIAGSRNFRLLWFGEGTSLLGSTTIRSDLLRKLVR